MRETCTHLLLVLYANFSITYLTLGDLEHVICCGRVSCCSKQAATGLRGFRCDFIDNGVFTTRHEKSTTIVFITTHVLDVAERSWQWPSSETNWQSAADRLDRWSHAGQRQVDQGGHLEIHPTSNRKPAAAPVALAWCGRTVERPTDCNRHIRPSSDAVKQWIAVVQATRNQRLDKRLCGIY